MSLFTLCKFQLKADALRARNLKGIGKSSTENVIRSLCTPDVVRGTSRLDYGQKPKPVAKKEVEEFALKSNVGKLKVTHGGSVSHADLSLDDCARDCIYRDCSECGKKKMINYLLDANPGLDLNAPASYHSWEMIEKLNRDGSIRKEPAKIFYQTEIGVLLDLWCTEAVNMATHIFNFKWQAAQFELVKSKIMCGDVLMVMDFAQNVTHQETEEIISKFRTRQSSTLHPIVCYYKCYGCRHIITEEVLMISPDLNHDALAVETYTQKAVTHLKENHITVNRIIQFTDNCAVQYKCKTAFDYICRSKLPVHRNFFGAQHGKGPADGVIGRTVQLVDAACRTGAKVRTAFKFQHLCENKWTTPPPTPSMCSHYRRRYIYVDKIDRTPVSDASVVPTTMRLHSARNTNIKDIVEVNFSSCFCRFNYFYFF